MDNSFNFLFKYLEKENINIDKPEFIFQITSHPNYPSILAIIDTLDFFGIENAMIKIDLFEVDLLPSRFAVLLENKANETQLFLLEKKNTHFVIYDENNRKKNIQIADIKEKWSGIVLLIEKNTSELATVKNKNKEWYFLIPLLGLFLALLIMAKNESNINILFIFILLGLTCSLATIKELFNSKSELFEKFCNLTEASSCRDVVNSKRWRFFNVVNLSDLSIIFYTFQFIGLFYSILSNNENIFLQIIFYQLVLATPLFPLSIYYQKFVEKKWCPLCLMITLISLTELIFLKLKFETYNLIPINQILIFVLIFLAVAFIWTQLKGLLSERKELKEFKIKALKFQKNYKVFKNSLVATTRIPLPQTPIIIGNTLANTIITVITNPFCSHCKKVHNLLDKILENNDENIQIHFIIKANLDNENDDYRRFYTTIVNNYFTIGENGFKNALNEWFDNKDLIAWLRKYDGKTTNVLKINQLYEMHNSWCIQHDFNYTPVIFVNGYVYPDQFDREDLSFFIKEVIEDESFVENLTYVHL
jgi:uncharacterized membrane protein/protein-disulfide isomerase